MYKRQDTANTITKNYEYGPIEDTQISGLYLTREYSGPTENPLSEKKYSYEFNTGLKKTDLTYANNSDPVLTSYDYDKRYRVKKITNNNGYMKEYYYDGDDGTCLLYTSRCV